MTQPGGRDSGGNSPIVATATQAGATAIVATGGPVSGSAIVATGTGTGAGVNATGGTPVREEQWPQSVQYGE